MHYTPGLLWVNNPQGLIPDFAFKKSKKTDPFKTSISQPLWNTDFIGPEGCEMEVLNGPNLKTIPWSRLSIMHKATQCACSYYGYIQLQNPDL
jgi:hypothetical protein